MKEECGRIEMMAAMSVQKQPNTRPSASLGPKRKRTTYDLAFKLKVVRAALERPPNNRIKPTCAWFPGIEPCQACRHLIYPPSPNLTPFCS